jgi:hypothetical protein
METNMQLDIYLIIVALFTSSGLEHTHTPRVLDSELLKLFQQLLISLRLSVKNGETWSNAPNPLNKVLHVNLVWPLFFIKLLNLNGI